MLYTNYRGWALDRVHNSRRPCCAISLSLSGDIAQQDGAARLSRRDFLHFFDPVTLTFDLLTFYWWARKLRRRMSKAFIRVCDSVCLFVRTITQKRMIPKCSNLVQGMTLG